MKIVSHSFPAHVDDWFALGVLAIVYPNAEFIRSRDKAVIDSADIVVDVGGVWDATRNRFDHHNIQTPIRPISNVAMASAGLVWWEYGEYAVYSVVSELQGCPPSEELVLDLWSAIDARVVQAIDAADTGHSGPETHQWPGWPLSRFFHTLSGELDQAQQNELAVKFIYGAIKQQATVNHARNSAKLHPTHKIVTFDTPIGPDAWQEVIKLPPYQDVLFVVSPSADYSQWNVQTVPHPDKPYPSSKKQLPPHHETLRDWAGYVVFAHNGRFFVAAKDREAALSIAEWALGA